MNDLDRFELAAWRHTKQTLIALFVLSLVGLYAPFSQVIIYMVLVLGAVTAYDYTKAKREFISEQKDSFGQQEQSLSEPNP